MTSKSDNWKNKIRADYKGILSDEQIEATIQYWDSILISQREEIVKKIKTKRMEKRTTGILGILGTTHRDGIVNEGYNQAVDEINNSINALIEELK